jgi:hypothetical protein
LLLLSLEASSRSQASEADSLCTHGFAIVATIRVGSRKAYLMTSIVARVSLRLNFKKCPSCHRRFTSEEVSRDLLDSDAITSQDFVTPNLRFSFPEDDFETAEHVQTYKVTYKCKNCGKEWFDLVQNKHH